MATVLSAVLGAVGAAPRPGPALWLMSVPSRDVATPTALPALFFPAGPEGQVPM